MSKSKKKMSPKLREIDPVALGDVVGGVNFVDVLMVAVPVVTVYGSYRWATRPHKS
jgi:CRISPR/Cas system CMR subunit Cmr4 (Cas7 group RAMP superfamily)